jgi:hypothetical protein
MKFRYDKNYTPLFLNIDDIAFFNLYQNYRVSGVQSKKLAQQRIRFFRIIRRVSSLVYEFEFPNNINIYSIILIIYLKLTLKGSNFYNRSRNDYLILIKKDP